MLLVSSLSRTSFVKEEKEKEEEILDDTSKLKIALWYLNKFETIEEAQRFLTAAKEARQRVRRK